MRAAPATARPRRRIAPYWVGRARDEDFERLHGRVRRLGAVSAIALGITWWLSREVEGAGFAEHSALIAGWVLMPATLAASLVDSRMRFLLAIPATLISLAVMRLAWLEFPSAGWTLLAAGLLLGSLLGTWFWFRWAPVPPALEEPFGPGRKALVAVHVTMVVVGMVLVAAG